MKNRPRLDEQSFEQLLAAAYVMQQQRDPLRAQSTTQPSFAQSSVDEAARLAVIADTQTAVHSKKLSLQESLQLVTARASGITDGTGAAIWLLQGKNAVCQAAFGTYKARVGQSIAIDGSRLARCFRDGQILRCQDARSDPRARYDALPGRADGSLLAVPIHHEGRVEGVLEVTFAQARGFGETDLRTCQILSGLVSEAVALSAEQEWKHILESERATLLEALDRIQPHLSKLLSDTDRKAEGTKDLPAPVAEAPSASVAHSYGMAHLGKFLLAKQELVQQDAGMSSSPHPEVGEQGQPVQNTRTEGEAWQTREALSQEPWSEKNIKLSSKPALREVQTALNLSVTPQRPTTEAKPWLDEGLDSRDIDLPETDSADIDSLDDPIAASHREAGSRIVRSVDFKKKDFPEQDDLEAREHESATLALRDLPWLDAETEALSPEESPTTPTLRFWELHWADVCLAASAIVLAATLVWAIWLQPSNARDGSLAAATPQPKLTVFEEFLVAVGLAEAPPPAVNLGAPGTRVWVDLHSALYYCPGAEPYGKTPKGKFLTQHEAQYQQFQPARGQPCD